ncbi:putative glucose-methanol-choline oxidoreductase [Helianthus debilis subsp. tardiflorus]
MQGWLSGKLPLLSQKRRRFETFLGRFFPYLFLNTKPKIQLVQAQQKEPYLVGPRSLVHFRPLKWLSPVPHEQVEISLIEVVGITRFGSFNETASTNISLPNIGLLSKEVKSIIGQRFNLNLLGLNGGLILEKVRGPLSSGSLELVTTNPDENPKVTFNYFKDPRDLQTCVEGLETIVKVLESKSLSKFRDPLLPVQDLFALVVAFPLNLRPRHVNTPFDLEQYCKDTVMTIWHYHGGCQVDKVVDHNYKVIGVSALRIIDTSTLLNSPGTNPKATMMMMLGRYI